MSSARSHCLVQLGRLNDAESLLNQPNMFNDASILEESVFSQPAVIDELAHIQHLIAVFASLRAVTAAAVAAETDAGGGEHDALATPTAAPASASAKYDMAGSATAASVSASRVAAVLAKALAPLGTELTRASNAHEQCIDALLHLRMTAGARQLIDELLSSAPASQFARDARERCSWAAESA